MLITISCTGESPGSLSYLLHKHPDKFQSVNLSVGNAHVFYPEYSEAKCTVALLLDIDPLELVKKSRAASGKGFSLMQYVNDRPYVASSYASVAIAKTYSSALNGNCVNYPELVERKLDLETVISALPAPAGGEALIRKLFEPLGYTVICEGLPLDEKFPVWGNSKYFSVTLKNFTTLKELLRHLYVLLPALDYDKHYFVSKEEITKLLEKGKGWLEDHPHKEVIINRYLINLGSLTRSALNQLVGDEEVNKVTNDNQKINDEVKIKLNTIRMNEVVNVLKESGASTVIDMGCGEGKLLKLLLKEKQFSKITGVDVAWAELQKAKDNLQFDKLAPVKKEKLNLMQGSLIYRDERFKGYEAATVIEVIEHLESDRLKFFERVLFEFAKPKLIVLTTPNAEYNAVFNMGDKMRHDDHRFEWSRKEFEDWAGDIARNYNYRVKFLPVGEADERFGAPTQMGVFEYEN